MPLSSLVFKGFEPSSEMKDLIGLRVSQLTEEAPSDATLVAHFELANGSYEGSISIQTASGPFKSRVINTDLEEVLIGLVLEVRKHLKLWRQERFQSPSA